MAAGTGLIIENADYNQIRTKIINVMGAGFGQSGYGQTLLSSPVATGNNITKAQWDALRFDILNARIHQDGATPTITQAVQGQPIRYGAGHPNNQYDLQADIAVSNKFNIGDGQFIVDSGTSVTRTADWLNSLSTTCQIDFSSPERARWFFNSGGKIRISASRTGGTPSPQNASWSSLLASAGIRSLGGNNPGVNFYNLTNVDQTFYTATSSGSYSSNSYTINVRSNVANNTNGGATQIIITVSLIDAYSYTGLGSTSFPDIVNGTLTVTFDELRASGSLLPLGTGPFTIQRPTYSASAITGS
jgi:hypothetical protein